VKKIGCPRCALEDPIPVEMASDGRALLKCDCMVIAGEGSHGELSGMMKNGLDHAEDLFKDAMPYFLGRVFGLIDVVATCRDLGAVRISLSSVTHALRGSPTPLGGAVHVNLTMCDDNDHCLAPELASQLRMWA